MIKVHEVHRAACFKIVVRILGRKKARKELRKVVKCNSWDGYSFPAKELDSAFVWKETPQGHKFWQDVSDFYTHLLSKEWIER